MLIIRGLADSLFCGCLIQGTVRQANYSPYYKKSATVGVNYSLTITLSMVLKGAVSKQKEIAPNYFKRKRVPKGPFIVRIIV